MTRFALWFALALCAGCGGDGGTGGVNSGVFSCDFTTGGSHGCAEYSWSGGAYTTAAWASACTQNSGTAGTSCSRSGAVGGCKVTTTSGAVTLNTLTWFYSGMASDIMSACSIQKGTFVAP